MATVKVIDAAAWAALPEISLLEGEDLATKGLASDTYRCIRSDVASAVVTQWTGLGVEWANEVGAGSVYTVDLIATGVEWATEVGAPAVSLADLVATGVEWANEVGVPTVTETGGEPTGPNDNFNTGTIGPNWTVVTTGAATIVETGGELVITCDTGTNYDMFTSSKNAPRLEQSYTPSGALQIDADFSGSGGGSGPTAQYQGHGILLLNDINNWVRFDTHHNGSAVNGFAATCSSGSATTRINVAAAANNWKYLRITRGASNNWNIYGSADGVSYNQFGSGFSHAIGINKVALWAHRSSGAGEYVARCNEVAFS